MTDLKAGEVRRGILVMAMVALLAGGCDLVTAPTVSGGPGCRKLIRHGAVDYLNFVKLNGITYTADSPVVGRTIGTVISGRCMPGPLPPAGQGGSHGEGTPGW